MRLDEFLSDHHVAYRKLSHRPAYTANRIAQLLHVPGREMAKSVLLRTDQGYVLAVVPATHRVDLDEVAHYLGDAHVEMANEEDMDRVFLDCERGAMPPFGSLYQMPTLVDEALAEDDQIVFEGQNHEEAIQMAYTDFETLEHPRRGHFAFRA
jgi:Ala-tRNA(Pro) deacylase